MAGGALRTARLCSIRTADGQMVGYLRVDGLRFCVLMPTYPLPRLGFWPRPASWPMLVAGALSGSQGVYRPAEPDRAASGRLTRPPATHETRSVAGESAGSPGRPGRPWLATCIVLRGRSSARIAGGSARRRAGAGGRISCGAGCSRPRPAPRGPREGPFPRSTGRRGDVTVPWHARRPRERRRGRGGPDRAGEGSPSP